MNTFRNYYKGCVKGNKSLGLPVKSKFHYLLRYYFYNNLKRYVVCKICLYKTVQRINKELYEENLELKRLLNNR